MSRSFESKSHRGRGAGMNPGNRFHPLVVLRDEDWDPDQDPAPGTQFFRDASRTIIATNTSPDIPYSKSINPYRGCEHGCVYCYARTFHEFLDLSAGLDFETKILVKEDAPELLRKELSSKKWQPQMIAISGVTDPYQPIERKLQLTRRCLQVLAEFRNPVGIVTKNALIARDIDLLSELARYHAANVYFSIPSIDPDLTRLMEPRTSAPRARLEAIARLAAAKIPVGVMVAPIIPGLTDHEVPSVIEAAAGAGASFAAHSMLHLPGAVAGIFVDWLERTLPDRKDKVLNRIRASRNGQLDDSRFGKRMHGQGIFVEQVDAMFAIACRKAGLPRRGPRLSTASFRVPSEPTLFD